MIFFRILALGALLLASPAFAEGWRVESVSGDVVSVKGAADPEPLSQGDVVDEGATVVTDSQASVVLTRRGDVFTLSSDTIVAIYYGGAAAHASLEVKAGEVQVESAASAEGPLEVKTKFFRIVAGEARFTVKARKEFADVGVDSGQVEINDPRRSSGPFTLVAGGTFREEPAKDAKVAEAAAKRKVAEAEADAIAKQVDQAALKKGKLDKKQSALVKKLAAKAPGAVKDGLDALSDDYDDDPEEPEVPKTGVLRFLFSLDSTTMTIVMLSIVAACVGLGYLTSSLLGDAAFGMFGNAGILLVGGVLGAGIHDLLFPPDFFWEYEPTPGILTTVVCAFAALIGACFARKHIEDRMDAATSIQATKRIETSPHAGAHVRRFGA